MSLANLRKVPASRVLGIDASTKSLGYAVFDRNTPVHCGEVFFEGSTLFERLSYAHNAIPALVADGTLKADYIAFEGAIMAGVNRQVGLHLAYCYGAIIAALMQEGMQVVTVNPLVWQNYLGNKVLTKAEIAEIKEQNPGKSASWYKAAGREKRKKRTLEWAKQYFDIPSNSDNISDAVGISYWAVHNKTI